MRAATLGAAIVLLTIVLGEAFARVGLGLGDPPLTIRDAEIEYLFAPSRCYSRFGNRVCYNEWSMRSDGGDRFDVLIMGDSVVNGGALTDQADLATELLSRETGLAVANISAGSWGPANLLAYSKRFGWFKADVAVFVFSSHDIGDVPSFTGDLGEDFPLTTPPLALWELATRYLPRYLPGQRAAPERAIPVEEAIRRGRTALDDLLDTAVSQVGGVCVLYHKTLREIEGSKPSRSSEFQATAARVGARFADIGETRDHFRDDIHLNEAGQGYLARVIAEKCLT
jgi:hypothetical protein